MPKIIIDEEFKNLMPPLSPGELEQLERDILEHGIRDPVVLWNGILLDGHNRVAIAKRHKLMHSVKRLALPDRQAALLWIVRNQLGRRNLTPQQASYLRGKWYAQEKQQGARTDLTLDQNDTKLNTAERIAGQSGVSAPTVKRDAEYTRAVDKIADTVGQEAKAAILSAEVRLTKKAVMETAALADEAPDLAADVSQGQKTVAQAKRELVKRVRREAPPLPSDKYRVLYADPPWTYSNSGIIGDDDHYGRTGRHYPSLTIEQLCDMGSRVKGLVEKNAVLFMWVTSPLLEECFPVIKAWGFKYKASFVWDKVGHNHGFYNSPRHELLLVCTRGSCLPDTDELFDSVQEIHKSKVHSNKPERFREIIDTLYTRGKRLELFARTEVEGWESWGNEPR